MASARAADDEPEVEEPEIFEQRMLPWLVVRTALMQDGLVVQVAKPFSERVSAIGYDRLLLEPATLSFVRNGRLWIAAALAACAIALAWPGLPWPALIGVWPSPLVAVALLGAATLVLLLAISDPRRITVFLDREQVAHPTVLRGGPDEAQAAAFVESVRRAIIEHRCRPPVEAQVAEAAASEAGEEEPAQASLADTLDALLAMRQEELLDDRELQRFQELAERR